MRLFIDVDGTLMLYGQGGTQHPNLPLIEAVKAFRRLHPLLSVIVWSAQGVEHAREAARFIPHARVRTKATSSLRAGDIAVDDRIFTPRQGKRVSPEAFVEGHV